MAIKFGGREKRYDSYKTRLSASVTPEGIEGLDNIAKQLDLSRSELLEQIGRGNLIVLHPSTEAGQTIKKQQRRPSRQTEPPSAA